jgi:hypothetical protein
VHSAIPGITALRIELVTLKTNPDDASVIQHTDHLVRIRQTVTIVIIVIFSNLGHTFAAIRSSPGELCSDAIGKAEYGTSIPSHLLMAIALIESGRLDMHTGRWRPWAWTIDVGGQGYFFDSKVAAIHAVRALEKQGIRSIDVGCMQVNLQQHPDAFTGLDEAFDPQLNTRYAVRFLSRLFALSHDWKKAVALYHSATPSIGIPYGQRVMAILSDAEVLTPAERWAREQSLQRQRLAIAWGATLDRGGTDDASGVVLAPAMSLPHDTPEVAWAPDERQLARGLHRRFTSRGKKRTK